MHVEDIVPIIKVYKPRVVEMEGCICVNTLYAHMTGAFVGYATLWDFMCDVRKKLNLAKHEGMWGAYNVVSTLM